MTLHPKHFFVLICLYVFPITLLYAETTPINVTANGLAVSTLFLQLSEQANINIVMHGDMNQLVHIRWQNISPRHAMQQLCEGVLVTCEWQKNNQPTTWQYASHLLVMAKDKIQQPTFITQVVALDYAKAQAIAATLSAETGLLDGGSITTDEATEQLILHIPHRQLDQILTIIAALDKPLPQVQIEARIMIARRDASTNFRKRLTSGFSKQTLENAGQLSASSAYNQNLPTLSLALIAPHIMLSMELAALEASGQVLTLAQPQVVVQSGRQGSIATGQEVPFMIQEDGKTTHQWKQAVLGLTVSPKILPNQEVFMELSVAQDSVGELLANGALALNTHRLKTQVRIAMGQTLVLGGALYEQQLQRLLQNPVWMGLPIFQRWFKEQQQQSQHMELLVLVTPRLAHI